MYDNFLHSIVANNVVVPKLYVAHFAISTHKADQNTYSYIWELHPKQNVKWNIGTHFKQYLLQT